MTVNYEIGKPRKDRRMRVTLLMCIGKTKKRIKTDYFVTGSDINRKGKIRNDSPIYKKVCDAIRNIETEYSSLDTFLTGEKYTAAEAMEKIRYQDVPTFFTYAERWIERASMKGKKNYRCALNSFRRFTKTDIQFSLITRILLDDYLYTLRDKPRAQSLYLNAIKKIYTDAEKDYGLKPFYSLRVDIPRQTKSRHRALDIDTIRKVFSYDAQTRRTILARDCAILSFCLCGTNSTDLFHAPPIRKNTICYNRMKTKDRRVDNAYIEIKIPKQIKDIVKRYADTTHAFRFHRMYATEQEFNKSLNKGLEAIRKELNLEYFTFYAFRHSWATIARNELGIDKGTVGEGLNHTSEDPVTDIYIRKDFRLINKANQRVVDYVLGK